MFVYHINLYSVTCQLYLHKAGKKGGCGGWLVDITRMKGSLPPFLSSSAIIPYSPIPIKVRGSGTITLIHSIQALGMRKQGFKGAEWL